VNQVMPIGGGEPFFTVAPQANQALVYEDGAMWHNATLRGERGPVVFVKDLAFQAEPYLTDEMHGGHVRRAAAPPYDAIGRRASSFLDVGIAHGWAGRYEVTPDHNALIGRPAHRHGSATRPGSPDTGSSRDGTRLERHVV
jgi:glycine/D-amino acid oxidase-like deaminating enzyme